MASPRALASSGSSDGPAQCREAGCNFFANEATDGLCSGCFKAKMSATQLQVQEKPAIAKDVSARSAAADVAQDSVAQDAASSQAREPATAIEPATEPAPATSAADGAPEQPKKKNRCAICKKKVGLLGFECKCGKLLCSTHRTAEEHECDYDYRTEGKKRLAEANPVIAFSKIDAL